MSRTVDRIVAASTLPLSIVIVGVGNADFSNMVHVMIVAIHNVRNNQLWTHFCIIKAPRYFFN